MADITQDVGQITNIPVAGVDVGEQFATKGVSAFNQLNDRATEMNTQAEQMNIVKDEVNDSRDATISNATTATEQATIATAQANIAVSATNNKGLWSNLTGALNTPATVNHNGIVWVLNNNIADVALSEPTDDNTDWASLGVKLEIDEMLSVTAVTSYSYTDGILTETLYVTGNKEIFTYTDSNLTQIEYTDTDGTTVLLTVTYTYDASNNLISIGRV